MKASSLLLHGTKTVCFRTDYLELLSSYLEGNIYGHMHMPLPPLGGMAFYMLCVHVCTFYREIMSNSSLVLRFLVLLPPEQFHYKFNSQI